MLSASKSGSPASTGYNLTRSLRFRASASAYLSRTPASAGNRQTWTWSGWVKRGAQGTSQGIFAASTSGSALAELYFNTSNALSFYDYTGAYNLQLVTTQVFRDSSAWYHIVVALDTTNATAANRVKIYVNGVQVTALSTATYPSQNYQGYVNNNIAHYTSSYNGSTDLYDGYLAEVNFIDGQALTPSSFGSTNALTGVWQPARYTGTYGTNGTFLEFKDNSALTTSSNVGLGKDTSGNGNYWTTNNISITAGVTYDSMTDVPTLTSATAANFAVLNPLFNASPSTAVLSNGNLTFIGNYYPVASTIGVSSGKYYFEATVNSSALSLGIVPLGFTSNSGQPGSTATSYSVQSTTKYNNGSVTSYGSAWSTGNIIGIALDLDAGTLVAYVNNVSQGTAFSGIAGTYFFAMWNTTTSDSVNFGQRPFSYTPPTGFVALCTFNLPTSTIVKGNTVMDATTYTGTGATLSVTNAGAFKPDLVWIKSRAQARSHRLQDSVRGVGNRLASDQTAAETVDASSLTSFDTGGFSLGTNINYNTSAEAFVAWQWQAGQGSTSSNTNGTITSTVSVNASAGFSIVTYTGNGSGGQNVGHGLGVTPSVVLIKNRSGAADWIFYSKLTGSSTYLVLNTTAAASADTVTQTSTVFSIGTASTVNGNGSTYVAYCWTPIAGFSAFGSYTGNGSTDGVFVYTGFRPKWLTVKRTDTAGTNWLLQDSVRGPYNLTENTLYPNLSDAESTGAGYFDLLSNGFKLRTSGTGLNASGGTYIYMCFAENPTKYALAR